MMTRSAGLGFGIAALFAAGVVAVSVFGRHDSWFARAAADNAARCLTAVSCPMIDGNGAVAKAPPPLTAASACAQARAWHDVPVGPGRIIIRCADRGRSYLYHMGRLTGSGAGVEQWTACGDSGCAAEITYLKQRMM
jgi:hypothetical protein